MALSSKIAKKLMGLSAAEKKALQEELNAPAVKKGRTLEETEAEYTPAERKQMEDALKKIGRESTKMAKGGMVKAKMAYGGMAKKKMSKGGMAKCGASNPASGGSRSK